MSFLITFQNGFTFRWITPFPSIALVMVSSNDISYRGALGFHPPDLSIGWDVDVLVVDVAFWAIDRGRSHVLALPIVALELDRAAVV